MDINFSTETIDLLFEIKEFSGKTLPKEKDLGALIELFYINGNRGDFERLIFQAKYVQGLSNVLNKGISIDDAAEQRIKDDFKKNLEKFHSLLNSLVTGTEAEKYFEEVYLTLSGESLKNLMEIILSLSETKKYFNTIERGLL